jgi:UDP-N-acetylglucosamine:(glucosyl)LPS alpha-1,2-N-acetylglucosaminyltransferase
MSRAGRLDHLVEEAVKNDRRIIYIGMAPHEQVRKYYAIADLVVIPSIVPEGLPVVAEEAISLNKPILGFNIGALKVDV